MPLCPPPETMPSTRIDILPMLVNGIPWALSQLLVGLFMLKPTRFRDKLHCNAKDPYNRPNLLERFRYNTAVAYGSVNNPACVVPSIRHLLEEDSGQVSQPPERERAKQRVNNLAERGPHDRR